MVGLEAGLAGGPSVFLARWACHVDMPILLSPLLRLLQATRFVSPPRIMPGDTRANLPAVENRYFLRFVVGAYGALLAGLDWTPSKARPLRDDLDMPHFRPRHVHCSSR
jgi:hypothetical protein